MRRSSPRRLGADMQMLLIRFGVDLEDSSRRSGHDGPLFTRWLPDGEADAIELPTGDPGADLHVWFERRGFVSEDSTFRIRYDRDRREVEPETMRGQAILQAGPLVGRLTLKDLGNTDVVPLILQPDDPMDPEGERDYYRTLGKRAAKLIQQPVSKFLDLLRTNYGQHWIRRLEEWDARKRSLGSYCQSLNARWSLDSGVTWKPLIPDVPWQMAGFVTIDFDYDYWDYLSREAWDEIAAVASGGHETPLAANVLAQSRLLLEEGEVRYALVEGVTALELAIDDRIRRYIAGSKALDKAFQALRDRPLPTKLAAVAMNLEGVDAGDVELAFQAIEKRNRVAHEGSRPSADAEDQLNGLIRVTAALLPGPKYRFPSVRPTYTWRTPERWEEVMRKARVDTTP